MVEYYTPVYAREIEEKCGFGNAVSHALGSSDLRICSIASNVNTAVTVYLNGPTMMGLALIVGCTAAMITFVA